MVGLPPEQKSFLFKKPLAHQRCGKSPSPACNFCDDPEDNIEHVFVCPQSSLATHPLFESLCSQVENLSYKDVVQMNINTSESWELPAAYLVATVLSLVWEDRLAGRTTTRERCRVELTARVALLRRTRWKQYSLHNSALLLEETINLHFN